MEGEKCWMLLSGTKITRDMMSLTALLLLWGGKEAVCDLGSFYFSPSMKCGSVRCLTRSRVIPRAARIPRYSSTARDSLNAPAATELPQLQVPVVPLKLQARLSEGLSQSVRAWRGPGRLAASQQASQYSALPSSSFRPTGGG